MLSILHFQVFFLLFSFLSLFTKPEDFTGSVHNKCDTKIRDRINLVVFRGPKPTDRHVVCGIDIGAYAIKLVALEQREAGIAFRHVAQVATPADRSRTT